MLARRWFAQDREDKRLYEALGHIENGFYVDIGAYEPEFNSVTKVFYDDGWCGINVEPNPRAFAMLEQARPRDINVQAVITNVDSDTMRLFLTPQRGWSSLREDVAKIAAENGMRPEPIDVVAYTLDEVLEDVDRDIHFLKIDVEGAEAAVIQSKDWTVKRPWVVVAEHNFPGSGRTVYHHGAWENILLNNGYLFKVDDHLNRWYLAEERDGEIKIPRSI